MKNIFSKLSKTTEHIKNALEYCLKCSFRDIVLVDSLSEVTQLGFFSFSDRFTKTHPTKGLVNLILDWIVDFFLRFEQTTLTKTK
jgi:hypothetical protein